MAKNMKEYKTPTVDVHPLQLSLAVATDVSGENTGGGIDPNPSDDY